MITSINPSDSTAVRASAARGASVQAWRRETATLLGISESVARHFGDTGIIEVQGKSVTLHPLHDQPVGPWIATAHVARPVTVDEADWCDAMLFANTQTLLLTHAAFGLAEEGDAVLVMRIPPDHNDPRFLCADLDGLLAMCNALSYGAASRAASRAAYGVAYGADATTQEGATTDIVHGNGQPADEAPELEASAEVTELIRGAALHLGASPEQAAEAARTGSLELAGQRVGIVCDPDEEGLVLAVDLGNTFLDSTERCRTALAATLELILHAGAAVGRTPQRCQLMSRRVLQGHSAASLAAWLRGIAELAAAMRARHNEELAASAPGTLQR
jgi:hypothetical protein